MTQNKITDQGRCDEVDVGIETTMISSYPTKNLFFDVGPRRSAL